MDEEILGSRFDLGLGQQPTLLPVTLAESIDLCNETTGGSTTMSENDEANTAEGGKPHESSGKSTSCQTDLPQPVNLYERKRMSLMHPEIPNRDYSRKNKQQSGGTLGLRRNPRRANVCPIDYNNFVGSYEPPNTLGGSKQECRRRTLKKMVTTKNHRRTPTKASIKTRAGTLLMSTIGSEYSPPSPLASIPRRSWPAHSTERPVWPDERYDLPVPEEQETYAQKIHHIFHLLVDYGLLRTTGKVVHRLTDDYIRYISHQLRTTPYDDITYVENLCEHSYDLHKPCGRGNECTAMMDKVKELCCKIRQLIKAILVSSMEADIRRITRENPKENTAEERSGPVNHKEIEIGKLGLMPAYRTAFGLPVSDEPVQLDEDDAETQLLVESMVTQASLLYCITNDCTAEGLAKYLEAYPVKNIYL